jgi:GntR family transcriptional regulator
MGVKARTSRESLLGTRALDRASPIPLYYQLARVFQEEIDEGAWAPGDLLPSEAAIGELLGVSRPVVRQALDVLQADGQVNTINGVGTIVAAPKYRYEATAATGDWHRIADESSWTLQRVLDIRRATAGRHVGKLLGVNAWDDVFEITVIHAAEQQAVSIWHSFIRTDATVGMQEVGEAGSLPVLDPGGAHAWTQLIEKYGIALLRSELEIEATLVSEFESQVLKVPIGTPAFLLTSLEVPKQSTPVAFTRAAIRSDYFRFSVVVRVEE